MTVVVTAATSSDAPAMAQLLVECVHDGASVGFLDDVTVEEATRWWAARLVDESCLVLVARAGSAVVGTVGLALSSYPNARHRAEVTKLLVPPTARGSGIGRLLLAAVEAAALDRGRTLLLLDTETDTPAQHLYAAAGWQVVGVVDGHAAKPDGRLAATTFMSKQLG